MSSAPPLPCPHIAFRSGRRLVQLRPGPGKDPVRQDHNQYGGGGTKPRPTLPDSTHTFSVQVSFNLGDCINTGKAHSTDAHTHFTVTRCLLTHSDTHKHCTLWSSWWLRRQSFFFFFLISHTLIVISCREDALEIPPWRSRADALQADVTLGCSGCWPGSS